MPNYVYACRECEFEFDVFHSILEKPTIPCPKCTSKKTFKTVSACGIVVHNTSRTRAVMDVMRREGDQRADLRQNYGVEKITPLKRGATVDDIYREVKAQGSLVRDNMQAQKEIDNAKRKAKQREWTKGALRRTPVRGKMMAEQRAKEAFAKRAVKV
jgi:putative FmdB family regulatory protein